MTKKSFFGGSKDESQEPETTADKTPPEERKKGDDSPDDLVPATHPGPTLNRETADAAGLVSPHNEAAAQRPAVVPVDHNDHLQGRPLGDLTDRSDKDRLSLLRQWSHDLRLGGPKSADWELFDRILGPDDTGVKAAEPKRADEPPTRADEQVKP